MENPSRCRNMFGPLPRRSSGKKKRNKDLSPVFEKTDSLSLRITVISEVIK
jgi:hypothetical protein